MPTLHHIILWHLTSYRYGSHHLNKYNSSGGKGRKKKKLYHQLHTPKLLSFIQKSTQSKVQTDKAPTPPDNPTSISIQTQIK